MFLIGLYSDTSMRKQHILYMFISCVCSIWLWKTHMARAGVNKTARIPPGCRALRWWYEYQSRCGQASQELHHCRETGHSQARRHFVETTCFPIASAKPSCHATQNASKATFGKSGWDATTCLYHYDCYIEITSNQTYIIKNPGDARVCANYPAVIISWVHY